MSCFIDITTEYWHVWRWSCSVQFVTTKNNRSPSRSVFLEALLYCKGHIRIIWQVWILDKYFLPFFKCQSNWSCLEAAKNLMHIASIWFLFFSSKLARERCNRMIFFSLFRGYKFKVAMFLSTAPLQKFYCRTACFVQKWPLNALE